MKWQIGTVMTLGALAACGGGSSARESQPTVVASGNEATSSGPFAQGQIWSGTYVCPQGPTNMALQITAIDSGHVAATFGFDVPQQNVHGQFTMSGTAAGSPTHYRFVPGNWIAQPAGYNMIGLEGDVSADGSSFAGTIPSSGCTTFQTQRSQ